MKTFLKHNSTDNSVLRTAAAAASKVVIEKFSWFPETFKPSFDSQQSVEGQMLSEIPTDL